jgi:hypothetical protein
LQALKAGGGGGRQRSRRVTFRKPAYYQQHLPKLSRKVRHHLTCMTGAYRALMKVITPSALPSRIGYKM